MSGARVPAKLDPTLCQRLIADADAVQGGGDLATVGQHVGNAPKIAAQLTAAVALHEQHASADEVRRRFTEQLATAMGVHPTGRAYEDLLGDVTLNMNHTGLMLRMSEALGQIAREIGLPDSTGGAQRSVAAVVEGVRATLAELRHEIRIRSSAVESAVTRLRSRVDRLERETKSARPSARKAARVPTPGAASTTSDARLEQLAVPPTGAVVDLTRSVDELELSVRTANCLANAGIKTLGDLTRWTALEIRRIKWSGRRTVREIEEVLDTLGLSLAKPAEQP